MDKMEKIGKVSLDYSFYSGQDLYSEGQIEDELLEIAKESTEDELYTLINTENKWEYLYHFSQFRKNIVNWIPFAENAKILEIGSGCGAITGALAEKGKKVDCVELSRKRSLINANRNKNHDGITIKVGNFEEIEPYLDQDYDVITLIGVWEYAGVYLTSDDPFGDFLDLLKKHIKPEGKIIIAIENKFGLKYWAGCREDHTAAFFEGLEGYTNSNSAVTFGRNEIQKLFEEKGYYTQFYYPYPDYKIPFQIFSDEFQPQIGMLTDNNKNFDHNRMILFDEEKVYHSILRDQMFPFFSNSFLVILSRQDIESHEDKVIYAKYSNERVEEFQIRTDIIREKNGKRIVEKLPMTAKAKEHLEKTYAMYEVLKNNNKNNFLQYNLCHRENQRIFFEFIEGDNLEKELRELILSGKEEEAKRIIDEVVVLIKGMENTCFKETEEFVKVFGHCQLKEVPAIQGADIDITFGNIVNDGEKWNILDYEWAYDFPIPVNYILYRLLYEQAPDMIKSWNLCEKYGLSKAEQEIYYNMERHFMEQHVYRNRYVLSGSQIIKPKVIINGELLQREIENGNNIKIYYDYGNGLSENSVSYIPYHASENIVMDIPINEKVVGIRIDPMEDVGIVCMKNITARTNRKVYYPKVNVNGHFMHDGYFLFDTRDPWFNIKRLEKETISVHIELSVDKMLQSSIDHLVKMYKKAKWSKLKRRVFK